MGIVSTSPINVYRHFFCFCYFEGSEPFFLRRGKKKLKLIGGSKNNILFFAVKFILEGLQKNVLDGLIFCVSCFWLEGGQMLFLWSSPHQKILVGRSKFSYFLWGGVKKYFLFGRPILFFFAIQKKI